MQTVKPKSSKYINDHSLTPGRFEWQEGYGAFSYGQSQVTDVYRYMQNQEAHHKRQTFREEYLAFLSKFAVDYEEKYVFEELLQIVRAYGTKADKGDKCNGLKSVVTIGYVPSALRKDWLCVN